ncbi:NADH-quinone oxidoreductase subunit N [Ginsengibacter hankyongi]|uniref:NADH-quinone oxidoreductase subunit N n=1 Tax=Ginsengibacter hankyongi TaxID=2607284 RepID=A0A5J5IE73_9BACT|nr:NADH-quinone oxidoreductase subunit N [Ginsengibacter hankyongi]KAA9038016.1 NADH-quinone oxidoreductase subunit N [Ginsengibacter hankyongi]
MNEFLTLMKPELQITIIIFLLLFIKLSKGIKNDLLLLIIQNLLLLNFIAGFFFNAPGNLFDGMYQTNTLIAFQKSILNLGIYLISLLFTGWFRKTEHLPEFFILMLSALLGLDFLISSGNFLIFFLSLELATIPIAAMANFDLEKKISSEAAMKMILSSAFSSGILLFGISLIYGATGTINFEALPAQLDGSTLQILSFVFLITAFAFKLSIVPFHLWTADVYEGSPIAATSFLSVISKGAMAFVFISVLYRVFQPMHQVWYNMVMLLSIITMIIGNLFALRQQNIKRFLAFSSIAQVGFILVGITANSPEGISSVVYFILIYTVSNLTAFGVAAAISSQTGKEKIEDYKGLYQTNPLLSWVMALALFSLAGIPPTAGFFGKLFLLTAGASNANYGFILIAALNMIVSLYYYLRVIRSIFMDKNEQPIEKINIHPSTKFAFIICSAGIVLIGMLSWIYDYIQSLNP